MAAYDSSTNTRLTSQKESSPWITMGIEHREHTLPQEVSSWLCSKGWSMSGHDPDTMEPLFIPPSNYKTSLLFYKWFEAIAYEYFWMMTIGGNSS